MAFIISVVSAGASANLEGQKPDFPARWWDGHVGPAGSCRAWEKGDFLETSSGEQKRFCPLLWQPRSQEGVVISGALEVSGAHSLGSPAHLGRSHNHTLWGFHLGAWRLIWESECG